MRRRSYLLRRGPKDAGFTLIELLVTVVIIGTAFVVLVGGTLTGVIASNTHREKADGEIVLRRFIDYLKEPSFVVPSCTDDPVVVEPTATWDDDFQLSYQCDVLNAASGLRRLRVQVAPKNATGAPDDNARLGVDIVKRQTP